MILLIRIPLGRSRKVKDLSLRTADGKQTEPRNPIPVF